MTAKPFDEASVDRFGFGRNWLDYQTSIDQQRFAMARTDIELWLGQKSLSDCRVLDIGSGSGIHSCCMHQMGAKELVSFDYDANSVAATRELHARSGAPSSWQVTQGSVLDPSFLESLGTFDLVYSWGVLHHTGQMWQAIANAATRVKPGGRFFISIYAKGPQFPADLALKQRYHQASLSGKRRMEFEWIAERYEHRARHGEVPEGWWTEGCERGMDPYYDLVDWLGGLPYEVATLHELTDALRRSGIETRRARECPGDGGCHILVGERTSMQPIDAPVTHVAGPTMVRQSWRDGAPVIWIGALDTLDAPECVVPLARALPHLPFLMVAAGYSKLDDVTREGLARMAPNLRIVDTPVSPLDLAPLAANAGVLISTAHAGPVPEWLQLAASVAVPVVSLHDDADRTITSAGFGSVAGGDLGAMAASVLQLQKGGPDYSRASLSMVSWYASGERGV
ncbi:MAG TPA: class I SAM-dependent methyltransferase [Gemmatimonadaceae bacterium]|nr:class I SAM-dependent methyltransferase [Gemmatimonadaceae bacterium]